MAKYMPENLLNSALEPNPSIFKSPLLISLTEYCPSALKQTRPQQELSIFVKYALMSVSEPGGFAAAHDSCPMSTAPSGGDEAGPVP